MGGGGPDAETRGLPFERKIKESYIFPQNIQKIRSKTRLAIFCIDIVGLSRVAQIDLLLPARSIYVIHEKDFPFHVVRQVAQEGRHLLQLALGPAAVRFGPQLLHVDLRGLLGLRGRLGWHFQLLTALQEWDQQQHRDSFAKKHNNKQRGKKRERESLFEELLLGLPACMAWRAC